MRARAELNPETPGTCNEDAEEDKVEAVACFFRGLGLSDEAELSEDLFIPKFMLLEREKGADEGAR
jgi:hypothetical protein